MQLGNVHYEQTNQDAFKEWELNAHSAQYFKNENKIVLQSITLTFYSDDGKRYNLTAERGELYTDSRNLKVSGNVVVDTDEGYQVRTDSFQYNAKERKIVTNDRVTLSSKELVMTGKGMVVDLEEEKLRILGEVRALEKK
jgi:LPS export ABC transporter protein LptC